MNDIQCDAPGRYESTLHEIALTGKVWGLWQESGWATYSDDETGDECLPIWPNETAAKISATDDWSDFEAADIELADWLSDWLPGLAEQRLAVAVYPTSEGTAQTVDPEQFGEDLQNEMEFIRQSE